MLITTTLWTIASRTATPRTTTTRTTTSRATASITTTLRTIASRTATPITTTSITTASITTTLRTMASRTAASRTTTSRTTTSRGTVSITTTLWTIASRTATSRTTGQRNTTYRYLSNAHFQACTFLSAYHPSERTLLSYYFPNRFCHSTRLLTPRNRYELFLQIVIVWPIKFVKVPPDTSRRLTHRHQSHGVRARDTLHHVTLASRDIRPAWCCVPSRRRPNAAAFFRSGLRAGAVLVPYGRHRRQEETSRPTGDVTRRKTWRLKRQTQQTTLREGIHGV